MSKDNSRLIKTICISGSSAVISYLINFFLTSFISENVGIEAYSFVSIAKTAVSYAQIITVALTTFIVRYISINYHQKQMEKARAYYSSLLLHVCCSQAVFIWLYWHCFQDWNISLISRII